MKLAKLELSGFKSFANTVTLEFEDGVTAIVGPNGCGKSNVSDAVRWVLGEQSARLLRGGKMEDVIFQGAANRRPVNVTEVSLYLDNSDGELPIAFQEVVITRRLSRSGQSDYLLNNAPVRLRDIQDLLRGTGMGSDAGVVIEAKMIDLLLSDRAGERRSLFEEAAGIGLYRDRKHATERRLEETNADLVRLEDLLSEVQSQIRSLARQKGKTERHAKLMEEKFTVNLTLARRQLDELVKQAADLEARHGELQTELPTARNTLQARLQDHQRLAGERNRAEAHRTALASEVAGCRVALEKLEGDLAVASERMTHAADRRARAEEERRQIESRIAGSTQEREAVAAELAEADGEHDRIHTELSARNAAEAEVRERLSQCRAAVQSVEQELHAHTQRVRSLEGERKALEGELSSLRDRQSQAQAHREVLHGEFETASARLEEAAREVDRLVGDLQVAEADAEQVRHELADMREREVHERVERRAAEEALAQFSARRHALQELERDRVGMAPAAASLLAVRDRFGEQVVGPLTDFIDTGRDDAALTERLLGEWVHAVLVRDEAAVRAIQAWHREAQPGTLVLLPLAPGPQHRSNLPSIDPRLRVATPAEPWVRALLAESEALDPEGRSLRRAGGAIYLLGPGSPSGPLQRRAELTDLSGSVEQAERTLQEATDRLTETSGILAQLEKAAEVAGQRVQEARERERAAAARRDDLERLRTNLQRELDDATAQGQRIGERLAQAEQRLVEVDQELSDHELGGVRLQEERVAAQSALTSCESEQEAAREHRAQWQVQEAHIGARLRSTQERLDRIDQLLTESASAVHSLTEELATLDAEVEALNARQTTGVEQRTEQRTQLASLETALDEAESDLARVSEQVVATEGEVADLRASVELLGEEHHRLEVDLMEVAGSRRRILERVETEWKAPLAELEERLTPLDLDLETLEAEASRIAEVLERMGPVNPLAMEEHAEEVTRFEFLTSQRDDLVAARQSLLQAIREIDGTARSLFQETFNAIQTNFRSVFQTLFGGGECDLRLADADDPLESEIEIHAAPRGKRTQRIHLLSSGERTLVAVSLLFSIYLTKPSPFCLMDEVDAPLDDANVGRFTTLLSEFKADTQFIVITHNPRTMQSADAVYGVTMQEPGVSTIVGVRLGEHAHVGA